MNNVETSGTGGWVVFCFCNPIWERHRCRSEQEARQFRCRLGCRPNTHHLITEPQPAVPYFTFEIAQ